MEMRRGGAVGVGRGSGGGVGWGVGVGAEQDGAVGMRNYILLNTDLLSEIFGSTHQSRPQVSVLLLY